MVPLSEHTATTIIFRALYCIRLFLALPTLTFADQFVFCPSGSTTAALIYLLHTVTQLLSNNPYVVVIALDFTKAFDTVRQETLLHKLAQLNIPDSVYNWMVDFLEVTLTALNSAGLPQPFYLSLLVSFKA